jgi:aminopeptidase S
MGTPLLALLILVVIVGCAGPTSTPAGSPQPVQNPGPTNRATPTSMTSPREEASAIPPSPSAAEGDAVTSDALRAGVDAAAISVHLEELQRIADENGGHRADGSPGFAASVDYVEAMLTQARYDPQRHRFTYDNAASVNLVAERAGTTEAQVVMLGAHLDSVAAGPGINDDGTGVATILALAERIAGLDSPAWTVRFAFWGAEEPGLRGSSAYVESLSATERERLAAYLNLEMLGSPNYIRFVHAEPGAPPGSDAITSLFTLYFDSVGQAWDPIDLTGKTDHASFGRAGIPTGGLFGGGRELKTADQAARFGGDAGEPSDPCSDAACDTIANINDVALDELSDAIAHVVATLAGD